MLSGPGSEGHCMVGSWWFSLEGDIVAYVPLSGG